MNKFSRYLISGLLFVGFISIGQNEVCRAVDKRKVDIRGIVTNISITDEQKNLGWLRVEGKLESDTGFDKAMMRIVASTKLEKSVRGKSVPASISEFKEGCQVEARFEGPVAESYPVQANAGLVFLLDKK